MLTAAFRFAFLALLLVSLPRFAEAKGPNIVFIMADDLGYRKLAAMGRNRLRLPIHDRFGGRGHSLTDYYAGSTVCAPAALRTDDRPAHGACPSAERRFRESPT
jgi:hypothetical protein